MFDVCTKMCLDDSLVVKIGWKSTHFKWRFLYIDDTGLQSSSWLTKVADKKS